MKLIRSKTCFYGKAVPSSCHFRCRPSQTQSSVLLISWEEAATWSYRLYTSLRMGHCKSIYIYILNFKTAQISCATRIFWKIVKPKSCASSTFRCMIRNIATCSFPTVGKLEATKSLSGNVSPQIICFPQKHKKIAFSFLTNAVCNVVVLHTYISSISNLYFFRK